MPVSKWKLIGAVLYLALRIVLRHPLPTAALIVRESMGCRIEAVRPERGAAVPGAHAPWSRFSNDSR